MWVLGVELQSLQEQPVLLTPEPPLSPALDLFWFVFVFETEPLIFLELNK